MLACALPVAGHAEGIDGNRMLSICHSDTGAGFCLGYTIGQMEGLETGLIVLYSGAGKGLPVDTQDAEVFVSAALGICLPDNVEHGQIRDVFVNYLVENPQIRHEPASALYVRAMAGAFPCPDDFGD